MQMAAATRPRVIAFQGINNFRDFGGWRAADGARVVTGVLFRSAHMARATSADLARLAGLRLAAVTDLRQRKEQDEHPSAWLGKLAFRVIEEQDDSADYVGGGKAQPPHVAAFSQSNFSRDAMVDLLAGHYVTMPYDPRHIALFQRYFDHLSRQRGGLVVHCAAGKDRTGILVRLTHHVLGVHPDDAMEDYLLSNTAGNVMERLPSLKRRMEETYDRPIEAEAIQALLTVEPAYIERCWAALVATSGSVDAYLVNVLGIDTAKQQAIRERLLS